ncbi:MAG: cell wall-binding repeat-containing protein [Chloroflexota bacterium]
MLHDRRRSARLTSLVAALAIVIVVGSLPWGSGHVSGVEPDIHRLGGADRYATAASISNYLFPSGARVAYVASGEAFPDALSAASAAGRTAPVLLTRSGGLPAPTVTELQRLQPQLIVVVGGGDAISDGVAKQLRTLAPTGRVLRYAGKDRFATAAAVSAILFPDGARTVFLANGSAYPDAVSGAPAAATDAGALLLVTRDGIPSVTATELARLHPSRIVLLGGTGVIGEGVARAASEYAETVRQWGGADRFGTSALIAARSAERGGIAVVANGRSFSDGVTGAAAAAYLEAPLLLTDSFALPAAVGDELERLRPDRVIIIGGTGSVSDQVRDQIAQKLRDAAASAPASPSEAASSAPPTAIESPTPTSTPGTTSTPAATAVATPAPTKPATPAPTVAPTPPLAPPPPAGPILGYGAGTVGGAGGRVIEVRSIGELQNALAADGPRQVRLVGSGTWDANGAELSVTRPYVTVDGAGSSVVIVDGWIAVRSSEVILRNLRVRTGDDSVNASDADAISINGGTGGISNIVVDHVEAIQAPDVGGITILNSVSNVTVQNSIVGEGLYRSAHPESGDEDGHSYAMNISGQLGGAWPRAVTIVNNLITTSESRNPRVCGAEQVDVVNNVIYNYRIGPACNPRSLNLVNNLLRSGPAAGAAGLTPKTDIFTPQTSSDYPTLFSGTVYVSGNVTDGLVGTLSSSPLFAGSLRGALSVGPAPASTLLDAVLANVGPRPIDATTQRILDNVRNRTGTYVNG